MQTAPRRESGARTAATWHPPVEPVLGGAPVNGLQLYFEIHGAPRAEVPPLVLLHGGEDTIETSFVMLPEGAFALFRLLPHAQCAILPGVDHMAICARTDVLLPMIERFLAES